MSVNLFGCQLCGSLWSVSITANVFQISLVHPTFKTCVHLPPVACSHLPHPLSQLFLFEKVRTPYWKVRFWFIWKHFLSSWCHSGSQLYFPVIVFCSVDFLFSFNIESFRKSESETERLKAASRAHTHKEALLVLSSYAEKSKFHENTFPRSVFPTHSSHIGLL